MENLKDRLSTIRELFAFLWEQKLWWMIPFVLILLFIAVLIIIGQSSPVAPFLYTAF